MAPLSSDPVSYIGIHPFWQHETIKPIQTWDQYDILLDSVLEVVHGINVRDLEPPDMATQLTLRGQMLENFRVREAERKVLKDRAKVHSFSCDWRICQAEV